MELPPLAMDTMLEDSPSMDNFKSGSQFLGQPSLSFGYYGGDMDEELCQDGLFNFKSEQLTSFDHTATNFDFSAVPTINTDHMSHINHDMDFGTTQQNTFPAPTERKPSNPGHTDRTQLRSHENQMPATSDDMVYPHDEARKSPSQPPQQPLMRFDPRYHQVLQEQLGTQIEHHKEMLPTQDTQHGQSLAKQDVLSQQSWAGVDVEDEEALRSALLAAAAMQDLGSQTIRMEHPSKGHTQYVFPQQQSQPAQWLSPLAQRPGLQSHHSFPGLSSSEDFHQDQHNITSHGIESLLDPEINVSQAVEHLSALPTTTFNFDHFDIGTDHGRQLSISMVPGAFNRAYSEPAFEVEPPVHTDRPSTHDDNLPSQVIISEHFPGQPYSPLQEVQTHMHDITGQEQTESQGDSQVEIKVEDM
jgi:hypothetical protein